MALKHVKEAKREDIITIKVNDKVEKNSDVLVTLDSKVNDEIDELIDGNLRKVGITKDDIKRFCDDVGSFVEEQSYFTMHSLRKMGFNSKLDELGFEDYFYSNILAMDTRFAWQYVFGNIVLFSKTNQNDDTISKKSFLLYALSKHDSVDVDDFIADFLEEYGMEIPSRYEINRAIAGTEFYYDSIMDKVYRNKDIYYSELDD